MEPLDVSPKTSDCRALASGYSCFTLKPLSACTLGVGMAHMHLFPPLSRACGGGGRLDIVFSCIAGCPLPLIIPKVHGYSRKNLCHSRSCGVQCLFCGGGIRP